MSFGLSRDSDFDIQEPCDCDITDQCDLYCCCDLDCNSSSIARFRSTFCLTESVGNVYSMTCDTNNIVKHSRGIQTQTIDNQKCYYIKNNFSTKDEITNYDASYFGISSFADNTYIPTLPYQAQIKFYETDPWMRSSTSEDILYAPIGVNSIYCNALYGVRNVELGYSYDTSCIYDSVILSDNNFTPLLPAKFCEGTNCTDKTTGIKLTIGKSGFNITNASAQNQFILYMAPKQTVDTYTEAGNGYGSGKSLVSLTNNTEPAFADFLFNGQTVPFVSNVTQFFDVSNSSTVPSFSDIFPYPDLYPTYGEIDSTFENTSFTFPEYGALNASSIHIYTILYKKYDNQLAYYYKIVGVDYQNITNSNLDYATIKINQIEVNDNNETLDPIVDTRYSVSISNIFSFMLSDRSDIISTTSIILIAIITILVWLDYLFYE
ncbi:hypothetical protein TVAG_533940 [Trichomonas vaginalis G3]|uniref:Tectonic-1-3 N-terminal domain-containing protein n=1 Tax=Trichomonas vaginalis (strain ATCC PRA-98 / G3) TaxID=412133 RepID=A2G1P1_TRIV3|nr:protein of unknown function, DUF1619 family [Trichomonas vaginalis G3]EAX88927.1 hypothetical protein TVAG_533940 [Trichomonas vaginalis G3]KAI5512496.1 protein of unknown function, DUF1619 family [Trichomonas vaginalis G3]|eukprot:XP_001301857.1 hypothetical protein [Trichomonas vaginalis G3]